MKVGNWGKLINVWAHLQTTLCMKYIESVIIPNAASSQTVCESLWLAVQTIGTVKGSVKVV